VFTGDRAAPALATGTARAAPGDPGPARGTATEPLIA